jgi:integrase
MPRAWTVPDLYLFGPDTKYGATRKANLKGYYWYVRHNVAGRKRDIATGLRREQEDEAREFLADYLARIRRGDTTAQNPLMTDVLEAYKRERCSKDPSERSRCELLLAAMKDRRVDAVTPQVCRDLDADLLSAGYGQWTRRRIVTTLASALKHAKAERRIGVAPELWLPAKGGARVEYASRDEAAAIIRELRRMGPDAWYCLVFFMIAIHHGQRKEAILELRWERWEHGGYVDLDAGLIDFRRDGAQQSKKRRAGPVAIPAKLMPILRQARARSRKGWVIEYRGDRVLDVRSPWAKVRDATGVDITIHDLGHTCVSWMLQGGISVFAVSKFVAKSVAIIESVYGHIATEVLAPDPKHALRWAPRRSLARSPRQRSKRKAWK